MLSDRPFPISVGLVPSPPPLETISSDTPPSLVPTDTSDEASASFHSTPDFHNPPQFYTGSYTNLEVPTTGPNTEFYTGSEVPTTGSHQNFYTGPTPVATTHHQSEIPSTAGPQFYTVILKPGLGVTQGHQNEPSRIDPPPMTSYNVPSQLAYLVLFPR